MTCNLKQKQHKITALILAGGKGTRLQSIVSDKPKPLAQVAGHPFITFLLNQLNLAGINEVIISTGYLGEQFPSLLGIMYGSIRLCYSYEAEPLGTGGALRKALPLIKSSPVLVMNGDSLCMIDLCKLIEFHLIHRASFTLTAVQVPDVSRYGSLTIDAWGRIKSFVEKGMTSGEGYINAGVYLMERARIEEIPDAVPVSLERDILAHWMRDDMYAYTVQQSFIDIGIPEDYERAQTLLAPVATHLLEVS